MKNILTNFKRHKALQKTQSYRNNLFLFHLCYVCCLALFIGATFYVGAVPTRIFGHDIFFLLDNGWRIVNGQFPHVDFTSAWGPVTFLITGLGILASGGDVDGVGYGSAIFGLLIGLWSYLLCGSRLAPIVRVALCLYLVCLVVSPYPLGWSFEKSSHAMVYNRYGYALLALILIDILSFKENYNNTDKMLKAGVSSGIATAILFFLKVSYFGAAIIFISFSIYSKYFSRAYIQGIILGAFIATLILLIFIGFDILSLVRDLDMAAGSRINGIFSHVTIKKIINNLPFFLFITLISFKANKYETYESEWSSYKLLHLGILVIILDLLIIISNQQFLNLPLSAVFSILLINRRLNSNYRKDLPNNTNQYFINDNLGLVVPGCIYFLLFWGLDIAGLGYGVLQKKLSSEFHSQKFIESRLDHLIMFDNDSDPRTNGHLFVEYVNDGIKLIQKNSNSNETVLAFDMFNPFSYSLGRQPPKGGIAAAAFNYTISKDHHPSNEKFFGSTDLLIVPKQPASHNSFYDGFYKIYESFIKQRFKLIAESDYWLLYHRT